MLRVWDRMFLDGRVSLLKASRMFGRILAVSVCQHSIAFGLSTQRRLGGPPSVSPLTAPAVRGLPTE